MIQLFAPAKLRGVTLANRVLVSPMCQYSAINGCATPWHMIHLGAMALSGAGLLCLEATSVEAAGRISPRDLGLWNDATEAALAPVLEAIRRHSKIVVTMQLSHAGRKASCETPWSGGANIPVAKGGWITQAPSALPFKDSDTTPHALDAAGLQRIRDAFVASAQRAMRLGIDGIELHSAHGYLLHQFLSPISNQRTDAYGGSLDNRMRFPLEVFDAVRAVVPTDKPVGVRISATDWIENGWDIEQSIAYVAQLQKRKVDWITASSAGISPAQKIVVGPGYQVPFAEAIKQATGVATAAVGLITDAQQAEDIIASGKADFVALARGMLYDPRWAWHAAAQLGAKVDAPPQYWRAPPHEHKSLFREVL